MTKGRHAYKFSVLGRYQTASKGNEPHVTVNFVAGEEGHLTYCGTLTMSESEWETLVDGLRAGLGDAVSVEDLRQATHS